MNEMILAGGFPLLVSVFMITMAIIWAILPVVLFFKIWGMTNDIREIRDLYRDQMDLEHPFVEVGVHGSEISNDSGSTTSSDR